MQRSTIREAADRIRQMELCFDVLQKLAEDESSATANPWFRGFFRILAQYCESGQWLRDYELDEKGLLPKNLKRGVLAQDALYDFLERMKG